MNVEIGRCHCVSWTLSNFDIGDNLVIPLNSGIKYSGQIKPLVILNSSGYYFRLTDGDDMTTFTITNSFVRHLSEDAFHVGNIQFSDNNALESTDGNTSTIVVGKSSSSGYKVMDGLFGQSHLYPGSPYKKCILFNKLNKIYEKNCGWSLLTTMLLYATIILQMSPNSLQQNTSQSFLAQLEEQYS